MNNFLERCIDLQQLRFSLLISLELSAFDLLYYHQFAPTLRDAACLMQNVKVQPIGA